MRWSPDERRLSFVARFAGGRFIYVLDVDSGRNETPRRLTKTDARFDEGTPSWSSNGRSIYFRSGRSGSPQIWKAPVEGGEASQITQGGGLEGIESPDGKLLYFLRGPEAPGLWSIPADGGVESRMPTLSMVSAGLWDVAERGVVFVDVDPRQEITTQPSFRMYEFATGNIVTIGAAPRARELFSGFSVTRDVSTIYWNQTEEGGSDLRWSDHFGQPNRWVSIVWVLAGAALALAIWKSIPPRARKDRL
jgi:dipeptidyl aminopeptidase/acylaminoacyl peptidase